MSDKQMDIFSIVQAWYHSVQDGQDSGVRTYHRIPVWDPDDRLIFNDEEDADSGHPDNLSIKLPTDEGDMASQWKSLDLLSRQVDAFGNH
ncbi:hypothetical protein E4U46_006710 [Claviceps purpurea]|nr:hypothetical protein E4U46_006710 [Claviceps purpurea]